VSFWDDYTPFGFLDGGSSSESKSLTAAEKRAVLLGAARQFGVDSIEYRAFAKRWKKQAKVLEKLGGLPMIGTGSVREGDIPLQPIYDPFGSARGIPVGGPTGRPPTGRELLGAVELLSALSGVGGAIKFGAAALKKFLIGRAARSRLEKEIGKDAAAKAIAAEKRRATEFRIVDKSKLPKKGEPGYRPEPHEKLRPSPARKTATKTATAREKAKKLVEKIKASRIIPAPIIYAPRGETPTGDPGGAMPGSGAAAAPTAAERARVIVDDIKASARTGAGPGAAPAGARARAPAASSSSRARPLGAFIPGPVPEWLRLLQSTALQFAKRPTGSRAPRETPISFPAPAPIPQPGLTPLGSGGVGLRSCECGPKKPRKPRKRRSVCYTGRFTESATGTRKYDKRKRTSCQPSRKKR
jgi:hypothetical protein